MKPYILTNVGNSKPTIVRVTVKDYFYTDVKTRKKDFVHLNSRINT